MKTAAIIAEYNPLHEGHKVPIDHAKNVLGAAAVIVIMSGDWVQRGEPAIFDKYTRANAALLAGADAVLECHGNHHGRNGKQCDKQDNKNLIQ